jgi:hypothetical protein
MIIFKEKKVFNKKIILSFVLIILFFGNNVFGKEVNKTGTTAGKFLSIGVGPRAIGMGGAFTSLANDASAIYWNPAGLSFLQKNEAMFSSNQLFADIRLNFLAVAVPVGELGTFGASVTALTMGDMFVTTENYPEGTGETFSASSYAFGLSYAKKITEDFSVGMNVKYVTENIFNSSASGVAFDIGTIFHTPFWGINFSSNICNYGSKLQMSGSDLLTRHDPDPTRAGNNAAIDANYATDEFELPLRLQIGVSKEINIFDDHKFTIAIDAAHPNDNSQYVNLGGELSLFNDLVCLRGGYKQLFMKDNQEGLTLGVGIHYSVNFIAVGFDYAYQQYKYLGNTHCFGVDIKF